MADAIAQVETGVEDGGEVGVIAVIAVMMRGAEADLAHGVVAEEEVEEVDVKDVEMN